MSYESLMQSVNTTKVLELLNMKYEQKGSYIYFDCPNCAGSAVAKAYGEKKNLVYCMAEKKGSNVIQLTEQVLKTDTDGAKEFLKKAAQVMTKIEEEITLNYDLEYHDFLKDKGIEESHSQFIGVGVPKGKTMLAGCIAFTVQNENGKKIAYYGIRMKDGKSIFHRSLNPELYLYMYSSLNHDDDTYFTTDMIECVKLWQDNKRAVCNFGLPYISPVQIGLLNRLTHIVFQVPDELKKAFMIQAGESLETFYRFS